MDRTESSAHHAHPSTEDHDHQDTFSTRVEKGTLFETHACNDRWVTLGQLAVDPETGEETEEYALYLCQRCAADRAR